MGAASDFGPEYFMDEDVGVVMTNYRVSSFGMHSTLVKFEFVHLVSFISRAIVISHRLPLHRETNTLGAKWV